MPSSKLFAVIGDPIAHSLSPLIHERLYAHLGVSYQFIALQVPKEELAQTIPLLARNFSGFSVTAPLKESILPYLHHVSTPARTLQSVNSVLVEEGRLTGYNTDGYGFLRSLAHLTTPFWGRPVLLIGAGGAGRVIAYELLNLGCRVTLTNRNAPLRVLTWLREIFGDENLQFVPLEKLKAEYDLVINATPLGGRDFMDCLPLPSSILASAQLVYDLLYDPPVTKLVELAKKKNIPTLNGLSMLIYQALRSEELWLKTQFPTNLVTRIYQEITKEIADYGSSYPSRTES